MTSQAAEVAFDLSFTDSLKEGHFILVIKKEDSEITERDICDL